MSLKGLNHAMLMMLAIAPIFSAHAEETAIDCRLKGGSVVQLPAAACTMEGGAPLIATSPAAAGPAPEPASATEPANPPGDPKLAAAQKVIVDLLGKPVVDTTPLNKNPEGIERSARFDGCRLMVDEIQHIEYGNIFSTLKNFKISSVIDLQKIDRDEFGILGKIASKGGELKAAAVYFEQRKRKDGNDISISVLEPRNGGLAKYSSHGPSAYWDAPQDDLWITDAYGYAKDTGWGTVDTDRVRILLIVNSSDDAEKLQTALEDMHAMCKPQQGGTN